MNWNSLTTALKNLALLVFLAMPLFFLFVWIQALLRNGTAARDLGYVLETGGVYYLTNLLPVLIGGAVHQVFWLALPRKWPDGGRKAVALLLTPVIPLAIWILWGGPAGSLLSFAVPMILALITYVFMMRQIMPEPAPAGGEPGWSRPS